MNYDNPNSHPRGSYNKNEPISHHSHTPSTDIVCGNSLDSTTSSRSQPLTIDTQFNNNNNDDNNTQSSKSHSVSITPTQEQKSHYNNNNNDNNNNYYPLSSSNNNINNSNSNNNNQNHSNTETSSLYCSPSMVQQSNMSQKRLHRISNLEKILSITPQCYLHPKCFFVSWNSVITLIMNGWPEPIDNMKLELGSKFTLCKEDFGSRFPKITLACVKDGIEMTPHLLHKVRNICNQSHISKEFVFNVDALSVVVYENRCQESIIYEKFVPLNKHHKFYGSAKPLLLDLENEDDGPYLRSANRSSHYRSLVVGSSIVYRLIHVPKFITEFQNRLPKDIFDIFPKHSLHVTVRALS